MRIFRSVAIFSLFLTCCYCSEKKNSGASDKADSEAADKPGFAIKGTVSGFYDSTWVFIESANNDSLTKPLDSAMVFDGHFELAGRIKEDALPAMLRTKNFSDYTFLWLENKNISFKGVKGEFNKVKVLGSPMQLESSRLDSVILPLRKSQDSINLALVNGDTDKVNLAGRLKNLKEKEKQIYISFIKNNPNSLLSAYLLSVHQKSLGQEMTAQLFNILSARNKNSSFGKAVVK